MIELTIGMASYNNPFEVWFTIQSLKMYHDLDKTEILVVDNFGGSQLERMVRDSGANYHLYLDKVGTQPARNKVFELAKGYFVLCIDSHVLLWPESVKKLRRWIRRNPGLCKNLIQGPYVRSSQNKFIRMWKPVWRNNMFGTWGESLSEENIGEEVSEIQIMGCGLFGCRKDSWLGFHPDNEGFGGTEGYIHEKYRKAKRKCLSLSWLRWSHSFNKEFFYSVDVRDRILNYTRGFKETGMDIAPIKKHFGEKTFQDALRKMDTNNKRLNRLKVRHELRKQHKRRVLAEL